MKREELVTIIAPCGLNCGKCLASEGYEGFAALLEYMASASCGGCRKQGCLFQSCRVQGCVREHGVDFCFECEKFPCEEHGFPEGLKKRKSRTIPVTLKFFQVSNISGQYNQPEG